MPILEMFPRSNQNTSIDKGFVLGLTSAVSAQLCSPQNDSKAPPLMVIYKKVMLCYKVMLCEWTSKQNILIADTILAEPGP